MEFNGSCCLFPKQDCETQTSFRIAFISLEILLADVIPLSQEISMLENTMFNRKIIYKWSIYTTAILNYCRLYWNSNILELESAVRWNYIAFVSPSLHVNGVFFDTTLSWFKGKIDRKPQRLRWINRWAYCRSSLENSQNTSLLRMCIPKY